MSWKLTWSEYTEIDHGSGIMRKPVHKMTVLTPTEIRKSTKSTDKGISYENIPVSTPLPVDRRNSIAQLLPQLKGLAGTYSLSPYVNDEGTHSEKITVEINNETWEFKLQQGTSVPNPPPALVALYALVSDGKKLP